METETTSAAIQFQVKGTICDASTAYMERSARFVVKVDGEQSPLAELRKEVAHALELSTTNLTLVTTVDDVEYTLLNDSQLRDVVTQLRGEELHVTLTIQEKVHNFKQALCVSEEGVMSEEVLNFDFPYASAQENVLEALKQEIRGEFEIEATIELTATVDGEPTQLVSDRALMNLLEYLRGESRSEEAVAVTFTRVAAADSRMRELSLLASRGDDVTRSEASVTFRYDPSVPGLVESLRQELRGELEMEPDADIDVHVMVDEAATPLSSDNAFVEMLQYLVESGITTVRVTVAPRHREAAMSRTVFATYGEVSAECIFEFRASDVALVETLRSELCGELELDINVPYNLVAVLDGDRVPLTADKLVRELLIAAEGTTAISVEDPAEASTAGPKDYSLNVSHEGEEGTLPFRLDVTLDGLLPTLLTELKSELDADGESTLIYVIDGNRVPVTGDSQIREILARVDPPGVFELAEVVRRTIKALTLVMEYEGEQVEIPFNFSNDDTNPCASLTSCVEDALDSDNRIVVSVVIESELVPITNDRVAREVLTSAQGRIQISVEEVRSESAAPAPTSTGKRMSILVKCRYEPSNEEGEFTFECNVSQEALLESLKQEIRGEFEDLSERPITLVCALTDGDSLTLESDQQFRRLLTESESPVTVLDVHAVESVRVVTKHIRIALCAAEIPDEVGEMQFRYTVGQEGLLTSLRSECVDALDDDLLDQDAARLVARIDDEDIDIVSDKQLADIFMEYLGGKTLPIAVHKPAVARVQRSVAYSCYFEGSTVTAQFTFYDGEKGLVTNFLQECRGELDLSPDTEVSLLIKPDFEDEEVVVTSDAVLRKLIEDQIAKETPGTLKAHLESGAVAGNVVVDLSCTAARADTPAERVGFTFTLNSDASSIVSSVTKKVCQLLSFPEDANVALSMVSEEDGDKIPLTDDDQLIGIARNGFAGSLHLQAAVVSTAPVNARAVELAAVCADIRDVLEEPTVVTPTDLKPIVETFQINDDFLPQTDAFVTKFSEFASRDKPVELTLLTSVLQEWTDHFDDETLFAFCHHCRNTVDMMVSVSPSSKMRRAIAAAFKVHAVGNVVSKSRLHECLSDSGFVDEGDVVDVLEGYGSTLSEGDFGEIMFHFFPDSPGRVHTLFSIATARRPLSAGKARGSREVDALRRNRLKSEVRHSLDGLTAASLAFFDNELGADGDSWHKELVFAVAALLRLPCAGEEDRAPTWTWFRETCVDGAAAEQLLSQMRSSTRSYASENVIATVSGILMARELSPSLLLVQSSLLSAFSEWCSKLAQLTCVVNRRPWPPLATSLPPAPGEEADSPPHKLAISPPRARMEPTPPASSSRNIVQRYNYKLNNVSTAGFNLTDRPAAKPLAELMAEGAEAQPAEEKPADDEAKPADDDDAKPADDDEAKPADDEAKPADDDAKPADDEAKPADDDAKPADDDDAKPADDEAKPADDDDAKPADDEAKPAADDEAKPADDEAKPADDDAKPADDDDAKLADDDAKPADDDEAKPADDDDDAKPADDDEAKPADDEAKPADDDAKPADDDAKPADDEAKPADDEAKPADDEAKPADDEAKAADDDAKPADDDEAKPAADDEAKPADDEAKPTTE